VLERRADLIGNLLGPLDLQGVVVDHADADLLLRYDLADGFEIDAADADDSKVITSASTVL